MEGDVGKRRRSKCPDVQEEGEGCFLVLDKILLTLTRPDMERNAAAIRHGPGPGK